MADLHQELAVLREFQNLIVAKAPRVFAFAVAADPHVAFVIYEDPMIRIWPVVAFAGAAPVADEVALFIELENRRSGHAALRGGRLRRSVDFHRLVSILAVHNPDVVLSIHRHSDGRALDPM